MQFPDYNFHTLKDKARFVGHSEVLEYLKGYCDEFELEKFIRFGTRVEKVERKGDFWHVESVENRENGEKVFSKDEFDKLM